MDGEAMDTNTGAGTAAPVPHAATPAAAAAGLPAPSRTTAEVLTDPRHRVKVERANSLFDQAERCRDLHESYRLFCEATHVMRSINDDEQAMAAALVEGRQP